MIDEDLEAATAAAALRLKSRELDQKDQMIAIARAESLKPSNRGATGEQGPTGPVGPTGDRGLQGDAGPTGANGQHGVDGQRGEQGPRGDSGLRGDVGATGAQGPKGETGAQGPKGDPGAPGSTGEQGITWRGPYTHNKEYAIGDAVSHEGSSWIARGPTAAIPTVGNSWDLLAVRGSDGADGRPGQDGANAGEIGPRSIAADAVTVIPAGNLAATDTQAALEELQTDIDVLAVLVDVATDEGTTADMALYVETTGNDSAVGSLAAPCLTVNGALAKIPGKRVRHAVNVKVGAGNFGGFNVEGFTIDPLVPGAPCGISILGTWVGATLGAGTATGTITATAAGNSSTPSFAVVTDSTQAWTVDALKGLMARAVTGGAMFPIVSNTATTFTLASSAAFGAISGAYEILDWATAVTTPTTIPPALTAAQGAAGTATNVAIAVRGNLSTIATNSNAISPVRIEGVKAALAISGTALVANSGVIFARCSVAGSSTAALVTSGPQGVSFLQGAMKLGASALTVQANGPVAVTVNNSLITNTAAGSNAIILNTTGTIICQQNQIEAHAIGVNTGSSTGRVLLTGTKIAATTAGVFCGGSGTFAAGVSVDATGLEVTGATTAVDAGGPNLLAFTTLKLSTCTNGVRAIAGAKVKVGSASTFTTVTNELVLDGTASTLAVMRAASPKLLTTTYGTAVYE